MTDAEVIDLKRAVEVRRWRSIRRALRRICGHFGISEEEMLAVVQDWALPPPQYVAPPNDKQPDQS